MCIFFIFFFFLGGGVGIKTILEGYMSKFPCSPEINGLFPLFRKNGEKNSMFPSNIVPCSSENLTFVTRKNCPCSSVPPWESIKKSQEKSHGKSHCFGVGKEVTEKTRF